MEEVKKHTPTPWTFRSQPVESYGYYITTVDQSHTKTFIGEVGGGLHAPNEIKANAEFIVKAVNHHEELVEALKFFMKQVTNHEANMETSFFKAYTRAEELLTKVK